MKKLLFIAIILITAGCNTERNREIENDENSVSYDEKKMAEGEIWNENQIKDFMLHASMIDKMQIQVGKMAQEKAANESVGIYGKMIHDDHSYSLENLKPIAQRHQVNISDSLDNEHLAKVRELEVAEGQEFDRKFLDMMIEGHRKDIEKYEDALTNVQDGDEVKDWIDNSLTSLRRHLQKAQQLQNQQEL